MGWNQATRGVSIIGAGLLLLTLSHEAGPGIAAESDGDDRTAELSSPISAGEGRTRSPKADAIDPLRVTRTGLPLHFEPNRGQADSDVRFLTRGGAERLSVNSSGALFTSQRSKVGQDETGWNLRLIDANPQPEISGIDPLSGTSSYLIGNRSDRWLTEIPHFSAVRYADVYPGIDLVYRADGRNLKYELIVAPGADPHVVGVAFDGVEGVEIDEHGELRLHEASGAARQLKLGVVQQVDGAGLAIPAGFVPEGKAGARLWLAAYDPSLPLYLTVHDTPSKPVDDGLFDVEGAGLALAADAAGNVYVAGRVSAWSKLDSGELAESGDVVIMKLGPGGALLNWTEIGGAGDDTPFGVAVDADGFVLVTGRTSSDDWPIAAPLQSSRGGELDAFVLKLDPRGSSLAFSTYLGGAGDDEGHAIALTPEGAPHVAGRTSSPDFPTARAMQGVLRGKTDAFVLSLDVDGGSLTLSTFLGGSGEDDALSLALGAYGSIYVAGRTDAADFPVSDTSAAAATTRFTGCRSTSKVEFG
jgi:hypothetical protein